MAAESQAASLTGACHARQAECAALERLLARTGAAERDERDATSCAGCADLCGKRVLCVGGRNQLVEQYRTLVARCNGRFEHHDGGIEDHRQRLDTMLAAADAVICTTDCVSHNAYYRAKRFCKRTAKPCVLLRSSGVSSFARAVEQLGAGARLAQV